MMKLHQALCLVSLYLTGQNVCPTSSTSTISNADSTFSYTTSIPTSSSNDVATSQSTLTNSIIPTTSSGSTAGSAVTPTAMTTFTGHSSISTATPTTGATTTPMTYNCITHTCIYKGCLTNATNATTGCTGSFCTTVQRFDETSYNVTAGCNSTCKENDQTIGNFTVRTRCCQENLCNKDDLMIVALPRRNGGSAISSAPFWILSILLVIVAFIKS